MSYGYHVRVEVRPMGGNLYRAYDNETGVCVSADARKTEVEACLDAKLNFSACASASLSSMVWRGIDPVLKQFLA